MNLTMITSISECSPHLTILIISTDDLIDDEEPYDDESGAHGNLLREFDSRGGVIDAGWQSFVERAHIRSVDCDSHNLPDYQGPRTDDYRLYEITCPVGFTLAYLLIDELISHCRWGKKKRPSFESFKPL